MRTSHRHASVAAGLAALVLALALTMGATASSSTTGNRLFAYVVPGTAGPLHRGDTVFEYIYVANWNRVPNTFGSRTTLPNSFVVTSVDQRVFIDGVDYGSFTFTPPPNADAPGRAGRWPMTVTCAPGTPPPCTEIGEPAVIAGENTVVFYPGFTHGDGEPNGTYVFRYTMHGTLNGTPVDLTASSPPIQMTE